MPPPQPPRNSDRIHPRPIRNSGLVDLQPSNSHVVDPIPAALNYLAVNLTTPHIRPIFTKQVQIILLGLGWDLINPPHSRNCLIP